MNYCAKNLPFARFRSSAFELVISLHLVSIHPSIHFDIGYEDLSIEVGVQVLDWDCTINGFERVVE